MNRSFVGHADLVRVFIRYPNAPSSSIAKLLGWEERPHQVKSLKLPEIAPGDGGGEAPALQEFPQPTGEWPAAAEQTLLWRATEFVLREVKPTSVIVNEHQGELRWRNRTGVAPVYPSLCPWPALIPRLRSGLQARRQARRIDWSQVVEETARGEFIRRLPCQTIKRWGESVQVILDRSDRLIPYWHDQLEVLDWLRRIVPAHGLQVVAGDLPAEGPIRDVGSLGPAATVLVLGDLGCLEAGEGALRDEWLAWGESLRECGCHPLALVPCAVERIPTTLRQTFTVTPWQRLPHAQVQGDDDRREAVERLLGLVAPAIRVEPGLLREIRALMPGPGSAADDASLEADFWQHPDVASRHATAATLDPEQAKDAWLPRFEKEPNSLRGQTLHTIRKWRHALAPEVWLQRELPRLSPTSRSLLPKEDWEDARDGFIQLAKESSVPGPRTAAVNDFLIRVVLSATKSEYRDPEIGPILRQQHLALLPNSPLPESWDPAEADRGATTLTLEIRQQGSELVFTPTRLDDALLATTNPGGSPFGFIRTTNRKIGVIPLETFWEGGIPAPWAEDWGRDDYGPWATFRIGEVTQRMRWVQPGRFWMGSPESEESRWDGEGPQHEVLLSLGFWVFDTPCTQELWQAVMGADKPNPSHFQGTQRPVEQVSFEDVEYFLGKINDQIPGLELKLPTEAQWEYACRAGTTGSRYGPLDEVAWYRANSGGETHEVRLKTPNAWGLYEMLGNVWEWCLDGMRKYTKDWQVDPVGPTEAGAARVIRGGSWSLHARGVRAAFRHALQPDDRDFNLGFRCLSSGRFFPVEAEPAAEVGGRRAEPGPQPEQAGGAVLVRLQENEPGKCQLPSLPRILIRSDLEDLILESAPRPEWAVSFGRDKFGLWANMEIPITENPVVQRLRWVPPGRFLMGSPETELGRSDNEGPQHEVVIGEGYWLFDTSCTQGLWKAVMGDKNPSYFPDPARPVEQVSFEDVERFIEKMNKRVPGLRLTLPTEAQWEYACRAGTTSSTYAGDVEIVGANNAPGLDAIAWYGGNSGHQFELADGWDSSTWPEKQYPHTKAGTRKVGQKRPNAWGLYEMLGNVWEWCLDGMRKYTKDRQVDPVGPMEAGAVRVIRGGGWSIDARHVRAANRIAHQPGFRYDILGFRCLSSGRS